jgi:integrase
MTLTKLVVDRAKPPERDQLFIRDDQERNLALRVTAGGVKSFVFEGRIRDDEMSRRQGREVKRPRRITVGTWPDMTVAQARDAVAKLRVAVAAGDDPTKTRAISAAEKTFGDLVDSYLAEAESKERRSLKRMHERINKFLIPWRDRLAADITPGDVALLHQTIGKENGKVVANRVAVMLVRAIFNHALKLKLFKGDNPAEGIERFAEQSRERFLTPAEMERVQAALVAEPHVYWRSFLSATLMLGTRKSELLSARWGDIDLDARTLRLPMTKNGRSHLLPIPEATLNMLKELPSFAARDNGEGWIFPATGVRKGPKGHLVDPLKAWHRIRAAADCPDVTIHDLRRTMASWMAGAGDSPLLIGRALGHQSSSSTQVYARLALEPLRVAFERNAALMLGSPK